MSHVSSTTANSAGHLSTVDQGGNSTSRWLKKVQTAQELCLLDGAKIPKASKHRDQTDAQKISIH